MTNFNLKVLTRKEIRTWLDSPVDVSDFANCINQSAAIIEQLLAEADGNAIESRVDFRNNIIIRYVDGKYAVADCEGRIWYKNLKDAQIALEYINEHEDELEVSAE